MVRVSCLGGHRAQVGVVEARRLGWIWLQTEIGLDEAKPNTKLTLALTLTLP